MTPASVLTETRREEAHHHNSVPAPWRILDNPTIAVRPIISVSGEKPHPIVKDMNLEPIAVMLDFMHPCGDRSAPARQP